MTAILEPDVLARDNIAEALGDAPTTASSFDELGVLLRSQPDVDTIVLGPSIDQELALEFAERQRAANPTVGVILVRRRIDAAMLTQAIRSGIREVVAERDVQAVVEAVNRSHQLTYALRHPGESMITQADSDAGHLISIFSPKGGAGKTTFAVNVGVTLASRGYSTLLLDLDLAFGDVPISLGLRPEHDFQEVVNMGERIDAAALKRLVTVHDSGLHVLAPPTDPGVHERVTTPMLRKLVHVATAEYQYVLADTAPSLDERSITVMENSETVFLLTTLDIPSLKNLKIALETLRLVNFPLDRLKVVMNRADSKVGLDANEVEKTLGVPVIGFIPSSRLVPAATNRGVALVSDQPKHPVSQAVNKLVSQEITMEALPPEKRGGLFGLRRE